MTYLKHCNSKTDSSYFKRSSNHVQIYCYYYYYYNYYCCCCYYYYYYCVFFITESASIELKFEFYDKVWTAYGSKSYL